MSYLIIIPILLSLAIYVVPAILLRRQRYLTARDFFVASNPTSPRVFQNSSIAYQLQMATFGPFFVWGASGNFLPAVVNSFFFCIGLLLVYMFRKPLFEFVGNALGKDTSITVHEFMARQHGNNAKVRVVSSTLTIFALFGLVLGETVGVSALLKPIFLYSTETTYEFVFAMLLLMFVYTVMSGNSGVMRSDQAQLGIAYVGLFGATLLLLYKILLDGEVFEKSIFAAAFVAVGCAVILIYRRGKFLDTTSLLQSNGEVGIRAFVVRSFHWLEAGLNASIVMLSLGALILAGVVLGNYAIGHASIKTGAAISETTPFSKMGLLALCLLPLFYAVVDITNWQRIAAFEKSEEPRTRDVVFRKAFLTYAIESPLIWFLMCAFGALAATAVSIPKNGDMQVFAQLLIAEHTVLFESVLGLLLIAAFAMALSTMSSVFSASLCAIRYDILPAFREVLAPGIVDETREYKARRWAIGAGVGFYSGVAGGFYLVEKYLDLQFGSSEFVALLFAFYCAQLSFVPLILGPLLWQDKAGFGAVSAPWALCVLVSGSAAGITSIIIFLTTANESWLWGAVPACLVIGFVCFGLGRLRFLYS